MWRAFTKAFTYGFAGRLGWDLAGFLGRWIKRILLAGAIMGGVHLSGYQPDDVKQEQQAAAVKGLAK